MPNLFSEMEKMVINIECFSDTVEVRLAVCNQVVFIPITKNWRNGTERKSFPKPIKMGPTVTVFRRSELDAYLKSLEGERLAAC